MEIEMAKFLLVWERCGGYFLPENSCSQAGFSLDGVYWVCYVKYIVQEGMPVASDR